MLHTEERWGLCGAWKGSSCEGLIGRICKPMRAAWACLQVMLGEPMVLRMRVFGQRSEKATYRGVGHSRSLWYALCGGLLGLLWWSGLSCTGRVRLECKEESDCSKDRPFCVGALCRQCARDADCQSGRVCRSGTCVVGTQEGDLEIIASTEEQADAGESLPEAEPVPEAEPMPEFDPTEEACDAGSTRSCYSGPSTLKGVGACVEGTQNCHETGRWLACQGDQRPTAERCDDNVDSNCNGRTDEPCCLPGGEGNLKSIEAAHRGFLVLQMLFSFKGVLYSSSTDGVVAWGASLEAKPLFVMNPARGGSQQQPIAALALHRDQKILATGDYNARVKLWEAETGKEIRELIDPSTPNKTAHEGNVQVAIFGQEDTLFTGGDDEVIRAWGVYNGGYLGSLKGHLSRVYSLVYHSTRKELYSGSDSGAVFRWPIGGDINTIKHTLVKDKMGIVWGLDIHPQGRWLAMGADKLVVKDLDNVETDRTLMLEGVGTVRRVAFSPNGAWLAASTTSNRVFVWDTKTWARQNIVFSGISGTASENVLGLAWSADSLRLAAAAAQAIRVWSCPVF